MKYGFYQSQHLTADKVYWAAEFDVSSNGRFNANYPPMQVVLAGGKFEALGDTPAEKRFNKLSKKSQLKITFFDTEGEAQQEYFRSLELGRKMLDAIKQKMDEALAVIDDQQSYFSDFDTKFESVKMIESSLRVGDPIIYQGEKLVILKVNTLDQEVIAKKEGFNDKYIYYYELLNK